MIQKSVLENGIRVVTEEIPTAHSVSIGYWVANGSRHEPISENGISHFIEHMLFKGTERRNALDIAKEIDSGGGVLNGFTSRESSCYYARVLAKKLPQAIDLLSDILLHSIFDPDEIEKERRVILHEIDTQEDSPDEQVHDLFSQLFWRDHPLGQSILGTQETVGHFTRDQFLAFMQERYCGENILICAAGDLEHQEIVDFVASAFQKTPSGQEPPHSPLPGYRRRIEVVEKDLEQVHICLGTRALPQNHPNRFESYLLNAILGGSMSSRLFQEIREERGLAYSVYSYLNNHSDAGAQVVYAGTCPEKTHEVVGLLLKEMKRFVTELVTEDELRFAKEQIRGNLLLSMESTENRMTRLAKNEIYMGRNLTLKEVLQGFEKVTPEGILKFAEFVLQDDYLNLQLLGKVREADFPLPDLTFG